MRVISGIAKGRTLKAVPGMATRPTADKVKEAVFSMIGPYFDGGIVLDLFAGTGGLGIEALSRGMDQAIFVDKDKKSIETIHRNVRLAGFEAQSQIYCNEGLRAIKALSKKKIQFHLIFLDPPYRLKIGQTIIPALQQHDLLTTGAVVVVEHDAACHYAEEIDKLQQVRRGVYGDTAITLYHYGGAGE